MSYQDEEIEVTFRQTSGSCGATVYAESELGGAFNQGATPFLLYALLKEQRKQTALLKKLTDHLVGESS